MAQAVASTLYSCKFEVFGKVQKVYFRKHCTEQAQQLDIRGWVMNTPQGTVVGEIQGPQHAVAQMKVWLATKGSPKSVIEKAEFKDEQQIDACTFQGFEFRR